MKLIHLTLPALALLLGLTLTACDETAAHEGDTHAVAVGEAKGFEEFPIGDDQETNGMKIAAVYFQPVPMDPEGMGLAADKADIHIEADISATADNKLGFGVGDWIPFMTVRYQISKDGKVQEGTFMPMNASDGPHYGANIKLDGAGSYLVKFILESPEKNGFLVHTDKVTGVEGRFWKEPIEVSWTFDYLPRQW